MYITTWFVASITICYCYKMVHRSSLLLSVVLVTVGLKTIDPAIAGTVNTCPALGDCMSMVEGPCDASGRRTVCLEWANTTRRNSCVLDPQINRLDHICFLGDQSSTIRNVGPNTPVCKRDVAAGADISFAIRDGDRLPAGPQPQILNLPKTSRPANCTGYHNRICDQFSDNDIVLTFTTSSCQRCSPVFLPPNQLVSGGCHCRPRGVRTGCSVSCGKGSQIALYECTGTACAAATQLVTIPCRCGSCSRLFDGEWSVWGAFDECAVNCETNMVEKERHRTCVGQRLAAGGRACAGAATELKTCNSLVFSGTCQTRAAPVILQNSAPEVQNNPPPSPAPTPAPTRPVTIPSTGVVARGPMDSCSKISKCFKYHFGDCTHDNMRYVCIQWGQGPECGLNLSAYRVDNVCYENNFASGVPMTANDPLCKLTTAGFPFSFGIDDGPRNSAGLGARPGTYSFRGNGTPVQATCSDYSSFCAPGGNNDLKVTFDIPSCP